MASPWNNFCVNGTGFTPDPNVCLGFPSAPPASSSAGSALCLPLIAAFKPNSWLSSTAKLVECFILGVNRFPVGAASSTENLPSLADAKVRSSSVCSQLQAGCELALLPTAHQTLSYFAQHHLLCSASCFLQF